MSTDERLPDVYLSLGSNIEPEKNLRRAVQLLREVCTVLAISSAYRTPPQGFINQPDFLNMAVKIHTSLTPEAFKTQVIDMIEKQLKRRRDPSNKNAPRTIDLDISLWGDAAFRYGSKPWCVPDEAILHYAHVVLPLAEIAPDFVHAQFGLCLKDIAARFDTSQWIKISLME